MTTQFPRVARTRCLQNVLFRTPQYRYPSSRFAQTIMLPSDLRTSKTFSACCSLGEAQKFKSKETETETEIERRQKNANKKTWSKGKEGDPRVNDLGRAIEDDFAVIREKYATPKNPIVLAHGLMGFDELRLAGSLLPGVQYWRGITEAMRANGIEVIIATVPPSASIENRAEKLGQDIAEKAYGKKVNIIAHSMGGLDARYMISRLQPENVEVLSLTTVASPHRGSAFADFVMRQIGPIFSPKFWNRLDSMGISTGAFIQLTRQFMKEEFNPKTPDDPTVRYFSYGAEVHPSIWSAFRQPGRIVSAEEGPNDGLVSVESAKWGTYKGTLVDVSHLDLINWTNRLKWWYSRAMGNERKFNAIAFYLDIADMLAKEGL